MSHLWSDFIMNNQRVIHKWNTIFPYRRDTSAVS